MDIAPGINASEWHALKLDDANSPDWNRAVEILQQRITARYIDPADRLLQNDSSKPATKRRFGFTILALDCLLVETLQAFIEGRPDTYGASRRMFQGFLTGRQSFKTQFNKAMANQFYEDFRCGILHQAEIQGASRVWSVGPLVHVHNGAMIINRSEFHSRLKDEFHAYLADLRDPSNGPLRAKFRNKMTYIARA